MSEIFIMYAHSSLTLLIESLRHMFFNPFKCMCVCTQTSVCMPILIIKENN